MTTPQFYEAGLKKFQISLSIQMDLTPGVVSLRFASTSPKQGRRFYDFESKKVMEPLSRYSCFTRYDLIEKGTSIPASPLRWEGSKKNRVATGWPGDSSFPLPPRVSFLPLLLRSLGATTFFGLLVEWFGRAS